MKVMENEIGWNFLDTRLTGTSSMALSGNPHFPFIPDDFGVAKTTAEGEFRGAN